MKHLKKAAAVFLTAAMALSFAACSQNGAESSSQAASASKESKTSTEFVVPEKIKSSGKLVLSTNAEFEPFEFKDNNEIVGIDVEIAKKIAAKMGVELSINDVAFDSLVMELKSNKCDFVAAGMSITDDKKENVDFSDPYFDATQSIIVVKGSSIKTRADLNGKKVGVQQGTTGDTYCTNEDGTSDISVGETVRFNKGADAVTDLLNGKIDAVVIDDFPAKKFVSKHADQLEKLDDAMTVEHYAIAVKKGDSELLNDINLVLKDMKSSGELDKLVEKYKSTLEGD